MEKGPAQAPFPWKRNLAVIAAAQFVSLMGFTFVFPFLPLFISADLGVEDPEGAALWAGIAGAAMGSALFVSGPIWGILGDRYGHKKNVLRALVGSTVLLILTGLSANVYHLVLFRFLNGLVSGTVPPMMALGASQTPRERMGLAVGVLQMSLYSGLTAGPFVGGFVSDAVGFRATFFAAAGLLAMAGAAAFIWVREVPRTTSPAPSLNLRGYFSDFVRMLTRGALPLMLLVMLLVYMAPVITYPVLPGRIQEIDPGVSAPAATGVIFGAMGLASAVASLGVAHGGAALGLRRILVAAALLGGPVYGLMYVAQSLPQALVIAAVAGLFAGAMTATATAAVAMVVPREQQGRAFGAFQSVTAVAFGLGPLLGGGLATLMGLKEVFLVSAGLFLLVALVVSRLPAMGKPAPTPAEAASPAR